MIKLLHGATEITIGENTYYKQEDMAVPRYEYFDTLWPLYVFGISFAGMIAEIEKAEHSLLYAETLQMSISKTATILTNLKINVPSPTSAAQLEVAMEICALIFNLKDENDEVVNDVEIAAKKADFRRCNASFFLMCAANLIPGLLEHWQKLPAIMESLQTLSAEELNTTNGNFGELTKQIENLKSLENLQKPTDMHL